MKLTAKSTAGFIYPSGSGWGFSGSSVVKNPSAKQETHFDLWVGKIPWTRQWHPLQCSWTSLVAQLVKNLPAMRETWVRPLDWEDPLEKGKATHSSMLAWRIPRIV